ncbi:MAG: alpha/beta hydrolase [Bacteroidales bacterium]|nr:alpha/beta hydrolase [Bacteroidales bacterium]
MWKREMTGSVLYKGKEISFADRGEGNVLVLLHGFLENKSIWNYFSKKLAEDFRVITIDLPGFGGSECLGRIHLMDQMANAINKVLQYLEVKSCLMIGHSMGGYVTLAYAAKYPGKLKGFGLFHSHALADNPEAKLNRNRAISIVEADRGGFIYNFIPDLFDPENVSKHEKEIKKLFAEALLTSREAIIAALEGMKYRTDKLDVLINARVPVLFILGKKDSRIPFEKALAQAALPPICEILVLDRVGHMGFIEARKLTLKAIEGFARKVF